MAECEWIVLCDYALADAQGKVGLIGIFDLISVATLPAAHGRASVGFSIIGEPGESLEIRLEIIGPLGQPVLKPDPIKFTLPDAGSVRGYIDVHGMQFKEFGRHAISIDVGDGSPKTAWFTLRQIPPKQQ